MNIFVNIYSYPYLITLYDTYRNGPKRIIKMIHFAHCANDGMEYLLKFHYQHIGHECIINHS